LQAVQEDRLYHGRVAAMSQSFDQHVLVHKLMVIRIVPKRSSIERSTVRNSRRDCI
jgi:hypothetical protein